MHPAKKICLDLQVNHPNSSAIGYQAGIIQADATTRTFSNQSAASYVPVILKNNTYSF